MELVFSMYLILFGTYCIFCLICIKFIYKYMSKSDKIENKYKYHVMMMKNAGIKYKGDFLDDLVAAKIIIPAHVEKDFRISQKTITRLRETDSKISISTLRKFSYVIGHYLMKYKKEIEGKEFVSDYKEKMKGIDAHIERYKRIFGYEADVCLNKIKEGEDLRQIVLK